jgi:hypothetical protein
MMGYCSWSKDSIFFADSRFIFIFTPTTLGEPDAGKGRSPKKDLFTLQDHSLSVLPFRAGKFSEIQIILSHRSPDDRVIENDHVLEAAGEIGFHSFLLSP